MKSQSNTISVPTQDSRSSQNKNNPTLQSATYYANLGFRILPIPLLTKSPNLKGWVDNATTSLRTLQLWFRGKESKNIGLATGKKSGIVVLDVDVKNNCPGEKSLQALIEQYGDFPETPRVRTGSGGLHYFFAYPTHGEVPTVHASARGTHPLGAGLDLQSDGAQVLLPPSIHPNGTPYKWEVSPEQSTLAPLPDWLYHLVTQPPVSSSSRTTVKPKDLSIDANSANSAREQQYALTALEREAQEVAQAPKGTRNNTLNTSCVSLGGFIPTGLLTEPQIVQAMLQACQDNGYLQDKGQRATMATLQSGLKKGKDSPRSVPDRIQSTSNKTMRGRQTSSKKDSSWMNLLATTQKGVPCASLANAATFLLHDKRWKGVIAKDRRSDKMLVLAPPPWQDDYKPMERDPFPRPVKAEDVSRCAIDLQRTYGVQFGTDTLTHAFGVAAEKNSIEPVYDYLESLKWDGTRRLDAWLCTYLRAEEYDLNRAMGAHWMISAVARTYQPGCQADHMLVLEGQQGIGKSTSLKTLFSKQWFSDELAEIGTKDASLQMRIAWVVELSELEALNRSQISSLKAFISRDTDHYRAPYAKQPDEYPRRCVFAGTTNETNYLRDSTGDRRFWPVRVGVQGEILMEKIRKDRDQLWAEAVSRYKQGEAWHLTNPDLIKAAKDEQADRYERDEWECVIADYCQYRDSVTTAQLLDQALEIRKDQWTRAHQMRLSSVLRRIGWERRYARDGKQREWRYYPPSGGKPDPT